MYKISVPVMNGTVERYGAEKTLEQIKRFDAERVFIALSSYEADGESRRETMRILKKNSEFFLRSLLKVQPIAFYLLFEKCIKFCFVIEKVPVFFIIHSCNNAVRNSSGDLGFPLI